MINQVMLLGRIVHAVDLEDNVITIAITRNTKNENGEYETDFIDVAIQGQIAKSVKEYCKKGDLIAIKGKVRNEIIDNVKNTIIVADRITFISNKNNEFE